MILVTTARVGRRRDHYRIEQALSVSGVPYTLLRANAYLQNFSALAPGIAATSAFSSPPSSPRSWAAPSSIGGSPPMSRSPR